MSIGLYYQSVYALERDKQEENILPVINVQATTGKIFGQSYLTRKNIEQQQADNAAQLLNTLPGINMAGGFRPNGQTLNIWGMADAEDVKIQLDGATKSFEKYQQGSIFIEPELLRRISVDKASHSPRNGNGGFGGTVQLTTKNATDFLTANQRFGGLLKYGYNTNNSQKSYSGALFMQNEKQNIDTMIAISLRDANDYTRGDHSKIRYSENDQKSLLMKINGRLSPSQLITLSAVYGNHKGWQPFAAKRDMISAPSVNDIKKYGLEIAWKRKLVLRNQKDQSYSILYKYLPENNPLINAEIQLSYAKTSQQDRRHEQASSSFLGSLGNHSWISYSDIVIDLNNTSFFELMGTEHSVLLGTQWIKHKRDTLMFDRSKNKKAEYNFGYFQPSYMPSGRQYTQAFYAQDTLKLNNFNLMIGTRYDHIDNIGRENVAKVYNDKSVGHDYRQKNYSGWSSYFGVNYEVNRYISLFSNLSKTWRSPVIDEQYEVQYAKSSLTSSSLALNKERMTQLRIGSHLQFDDLLSENDLFEFKTTLFHHQGKNEIVKNRGVSCVEKLNDQDCSLSTGNYRNLPSYHIQGIELEANYHSTYWFSGISYSHIKGKRATSPRNPWNGIATWIAEIPPRKAIVTVGRNVPNWGIIIGWKGEFVRKQDRSPTAQDPKAGYWGMPKSSGYALHSLFTTWRPKQIKDLQLQLTVDNLFNRSYHPYLGELASGTGRNIKFSIAKQF
ncbi:TonB-dependent hemoglobin/transferrin/lactoferrin family receptor [Nicoletella semolina]|nr:TonB-dependent hemoglobin/transferrin/lactoferrin family receptor [Nicoletella semolina]